jgi:hypothetical protein
MSDDVLLSSSRSVFCVASLTQSFLRLTLSSLASARPERCATVCVTASTRRPGAARHAAGRAASEVRLIASAARRAAEAEEERSFWFVTTTTKRSTPRPSQGVDATLRGSWETTAISLSAAARDAAAGVGDAVSARWTSFSIAACPTRVAVEQGS